MSNEFSLAILEISRKATTERVVGSRKVTDKPCWVLSTLIEPTSAENLSEVKLLNGETSASECLIYLKERYAHPTHNGPFPIYFNRGLFSACVTGADGCTIQYLEDSP
jgi:hypothetical protein